MIGWPNNCFILLFIFTQLTISYSNTSRCRDIRKAQILSAYYFECDCSLCLSNPNELPEAYRTARLCECGEMIIGTRTECPKCKSPVRFYTQAECDFFRKTFYQGNPKSRLQLYDYLCKKLYPTHWLRGILHEGVFNDDETNERIEDFIPLICDMKTGRFHRAILMDPFEEATSIFPFMMAVGYNDKTKHLITPEASFFWWSKFQRGLDHDSPLYKHVMTFFTWKNYQ